MSYVPLKVIAGCFASVILLFAQDPIAEGKRKLFEAELRLKRAELERDRAKLAVKAAPGDEERTTAEAALSRLEKEHAQLVLKFEAAKLDLRSAELEGQEAAAKQAASDAVEKKQASLGLADLLPLAQTGDKEAQYQVGLVFAEPRGVQRDLIQAAEWFAKAAAQGHVPAMRRLGLLFKDTPLLWPGREAEGLQLLRAASEKGDAEATSEVAFSTEDPADRLRLHRLAITQGSVLSQYHLGMLILEGNGTPKDQAEGLRQIELARKTANPRVLVLLANAHDEGTIGGKDPAQATRLLEQASAQGDAQATYLLGRRLMKGEGADKNPTEGQRLIRLAASQWDADAQSTLGKMYKEGEAVDRNVDEAARLLGLAASQGDSFALTDLGELLLDSSLGKPDVEKGLSYLRRAAASGNEFAAIRLAVELMVGWNLPRDVAAARKTLPSRFTFLASLKFRLAYSYPLYANGAGMDYAENSKMEKLFERAIQGDDKAAREFAAFMDRPRDKWKKPSSFSFSESATRVLNAVNEALATAPPLPR